MSVTISVEWLVGITTFAGACFGAGMWLANIAGRIAVLRTIVHHNGKTLEDHAKAIAVNVEEHRQVSAALAAIVERCKLLHPMAAPPPMVGVTHERNTVQP